MKLNYFVIPGLTLLVGWMGSQFTNQGLQGWYQSINLPPWTPPGAVIGVVWTIIYILTAISALMVWNQQNTQVNFNATIKLIFGLFIVNGVLNAFWSYLFFQVNELALAVFEAGILGLTVYALIYFIWGRSKTAAWLLAPYAVWVTFATYLTYSVWNLN